MRSDVVLGVCPEERAEGTGERASVLIGVEDGAGGEFLVP